MGVGVSGWRLARAVSVLGQMGVVSGTALGVILARRLQLGDIGGHVRRALAHFPIPGVAERLLARHYVPGGKPAAAPFKLTPVPVLRPAPVDVELIVAGNFVEVFLAKEGHSGVVGINYLEKIQFPTLPSLYGAMLAGVDFILMGAGIPRAIPGALDDLAAGQAVRLRLDVEGVLPGEEYDLQFDPVAFCGGTPLHPKRPWFLAIVASSTLATALVRKASGKVNGFVIEGPTAGGHNAPPRGDLHFNASGEPVYGPRDVPDLAKFRALGLPFWLAGSFGHPERVREAVEAGAAGVQVGTAFAFCEESGVTQELKQRVVDQCLRGESHVFTDPLVSPTGFPFKVLQLNGTVSQPIVHEARQRICDLGYLRHAYRKEDGTLGYRCPAEPVEEYLRKGGEKSETVGRKCICNGLLSAMGLGQVIPDERPLLTAGDDVTQIVRFLKPGQRSYTAADVLTYLLGSLPPTVPPSLPSPA